MRGLMATFTTVRDRHPAVAWVGRHWQLIAHAAGLIVVLAYARYIFDAGPDHNDAYGFWVAWDGGLYDIPWLDRGAYVYSPAFAQAISPLASRSWEAFWLIWLLVQVAALLIVAGPAWSGIVLLLPWPSVEYYPNAVAASIDNGNPQLLLALAIVAGFRWPGAWALVLLTKVTPGIGVLWFGLRREWRRLAFALGTTLAIVAISAAVTPVLWIEWLGLLAQAAAADALTMEPILPLPLVVRVPLAIAILVWGARTDRFWSVPAAACLALPAIQLGGFALLVAAIPLLRLPLAPRWPLAGRGHTARGKAACGVRGLSGDR